MRRQEAGFGMVEVLASLALVAILGVIIGKMMTGTANQVRTAEQTVGATLQAAFLEQFFKKYDLCKELGVIGPKGEVVSRLPSDDQLCKYGAICAKPPEQLLDCSSDTGGVCAAPYPFRAAATLPNLASVRPDLASSSFSVLPGSATKATLSSGAEIYTISLHLTVPRNMGGAVGFDFPLLIELRGTGDAGRALAGDGAAGDPRDIVSCNASGTSRTDAGPGDPQALCESLGFTWQDGACSANPPGLPPDQDNDLQYARVNNSDATLKKKLQAVKQDQLVSCQIGANTYSCRRDIEPGVRGTCIYLKANGSAKQSVGLMQGTYNGKVTNPPTYVTKEGWTMNGDYCTGVYYYSGAGPAPADMSFGDQVPGGDEDSLAPSMPDAQLDVEDGGDGGDVGGGEPDPSPTP